MIISQEEIYNIQDAQHLEAYYADNKSVKKYKAIAPHFGRFLQYFGIKLSDEDIKVLESLGLLTFHIDNLIDEHNIEISEIIEEIRASEPTKLKIIADMRNQISRTGSISDFDNAAIATLEEIMSQKCDGNTQYIISRLREGMATANIFIAVISQSIPDKEKEALSNFLRHISAAGNLLDTAYDLRKDEKYNFKNIVDLLRYLPSECVMSIVSCPAKIKIMIHGGGIFWRSIF